MLRILIQSTTMAFMVTLPIYSNFMKSSWNLLMFAKCKLSSNILQTNIPCSVDECVNLFIYWLLLVT